jgi:alpha-tubulin suppressor-like RCC1 family protein
MTDAVQLATGSTHACARRRDGTVACWGSNTRGQLGDGTTTDSAAPVSVVGLADVVHVAAGANVSCAVVASGAAYCWGSNALGGLGDGSTTDRSRPVAVTGVSDAAEVALGGGQTCVRRTTGAVVCWGDAGAGGFGDGSTETARRTAPGAAVAALAGGRAHRGREHVRLRDDGRRGSMLGWQLRDAGDARAVGAIRDGDPRAHASD